MNNIVTISWGVAIGCTIGLIWMNLRLVKMLRESNRFLAEASMALTRGSRAVGCLATKLNKHGYVDITAEEWEATEKIKLTMMAYEGGVRVLAE